MLAEKQKSLFSEKAADRQVIKSLIGEISKLKGEKKMSKVIKSVDGKFYLVHDWDELSPDQVTGEVAILQNELKELESIAPVPEEAPAEPAPADAPANPEQPSEPAAPVADPAPVAPEAAPVAPEAPVDPNVAAPAPADQPAVDAAPAADLNMQ